MRHFLGGSPEATEPDPDAASRLFQASDDMRPLFELMKQDQDSRQGEGHWRIYLRLSWDRTTQHPGYTYADFAKITAPTLILSGDRDNFCSVEQAVEAYRQQSKRGAGSPAQPRPLHPAGRDRGDDRVLRTSARRNFVAEVKERCAVGLVR
jgi:pimeloyl-ACP methyl ester carboxylesterase